MAVSQTCLVDDLGSFEGYWSGITDFSLLEFVWCFPHDEAGIVGFGEEEHRGKVPFLSCHAKGILLIWFITFDADLITWLRNYLWSLLSLWSYCSLTLHIIFFGKDSLCIAHTWGQNIYIRYLEFCLGDFCFTHSVIYINMGLQYLFLYFGL